MLRRLAQVCSCDGLPGCHRYGTLRSEAKLPLAKGSVTGYTIGLKRPTTSCKRPVIWPSEADFDRFQQSRKAIFTALHNIDQFVERAFRFLRILLFEFRQAINLQLLFLRVACGRVLFPARHLRRCDIYSSR